MKVTRFFLRFLVLGTCVLLLSASFFFTTSSQRIAHASGNTTYYVNNQSGANCNDSNPGTDPSAPFCDFTPINNHGAFGPGDHILLACGANWTMGGSTAATMVQLSGSGASGNPIVLDAYDPGNPASDQCSQRPQLFGNSTLGTIVILIHNPSFWTVSNLELGYGTVGLSAFFTQTGNQDYTVTNLYVHDFNGYTTFTCDPTLGTNQGFGILLGGDGSSVSSSPSNPILNGFTAEYIEGTRNQESLGQTCIGDIANAVMDHIYIHDNNGSNANGTTNGANCQDAFRPAGMVHALVYDVLVTNNLGCPNPTKYGTASVFAQGSSDMTLVNSDIQLTPDSGSPDQMGMDFENDNNQVRLRDTYLGENAGAGLTVFGIHGSSDYQTGLEFSDNTFDHNGTAQKGSYVGGMLQLGSDTQPTGTITGNLFAEPTGFLTTDGGTWSGFTQSNNLDISSGPRVYNAVHDFSGTQGQNGWSYQTSSDSGASWSNFSTYNSGSFPTWDNGVPHWPYITQFDMGPGNNTWVSRTWTAPTSGTVSIRGRAFKSDIRGGDGVGVSIQLNGSPIFNRQTIGATDQVGIATDADNVSVNAGDVIRFIVDPGNNGDGSYDMTSWTPSIGYTSVSASNSLPVADSGFESPNVGNGNFAYSQNISGGSWTFGRAYGSGISGNGSGFTNGNPNAPEGSQVALLQQGAGTISQSISGFSSGTNYTLTFSAAQRGNCCGAGNEDFQVLLDGTVIGTFTPTGTSYSDYSTTFTTTSGSHTLEFQGLDSGGGDRTAFIDNVRITY